VTVVTLTNLTETSYSDTNEPPIADAVYRMWATYTNGQSSMITDSMSVNQADGFAAADALVTRGRDGKLFLLLPGQPANLAGVRLHRSAEEVTYPYRDLNPAGPYPRTLSFLPNLTANFLDIPSGALSNGVYQLPDSFVPDFGRYAFESELLFSNGLFSARQATPFSTLFERWLANGYWLFGSDPESPSSRIKFPWIDTRPYSEENLKFLLRAATDEAFAVRIHTNTEPVSGQQFNELCIYPGAPDYHGETFISLQVEWYLYWGGTALDPLAPVARNHLYRNWSFSSGDLQPNNRPNTHSWSWIHPALLCLSREAYDQKYWFSAPDYVAAASGSNPPGYAIGTGNVFDAHYAHPVDELFLPTNFVYSRLGFTSADGVVALAASVTNLFGLPLLSLRLANYEPPYSITDISPGQQLSIGSSQFGIYSSFAEPQFQVAGYFYSDGNQGFVGDAGFGGSTNQPFFLTDVGRAYSLAVWAKKAIVNGAGNKFIYVGQHFGAAYKLAGNGAVTTNETGILSPYGEFLPTEPGRVALVTLPDIQSGLRGTAIVHCVGIQLDANHDGTMNYSFTGPDATSATRPYVFWENNDVDRGHVVDGSDFEEDDLLASDTSIPTLQRVPDSQYLSFALGPEGNPAIPSLRDLEDYTRLHIRGLSNLCTQLPADHIVELLWQGEGFDTPAIRLFKAVEADGGNQYLVNEGVASNQVNFFSAPYIGTVDTFSPVLLSDGASRQLGVYPSEHYIFCGARRGMGELVLRIWNPDDFFSTPLLEASAWIEIKDIKEMYERYTVGDSGSMEPLTNAIPAAEAPEGVNPRFRYPLAVAPGMPYILHVHGWNMPVWEKDRYAETMFKRLYWQGYQGHFGSFRWPTRHGFDASAWDLITSPNHFDLSEFNAWKSAAPLRRLLTDLNSRYPDQVRLTAHSMGNIVASQALRTNTPLVNVYAAMQGAVAAHAFDPTTTNRSIGILFDDGTPDRHAQYWTNGAAAYFAGSSGASRSVNLFNRRDWAFNSLHWQLDQDLKPANSMGYGYNLATDEFYHGTSEDVLSFPADTFEIFSFGVEARCFAIGTQPGVAGVFTANDEVDLDAQFQFAERHKGHSAQFRSTNMKRWLFWDELLDKLGITQ
jgi:hypothetical protein